MLNMLTFRWWIRRRTDIASEFCSLQQLGFDLFAKSEEMEMEYCKSISLIVFVCPTIFDHIIFFYLPHETYVTIKVIHYQTLGYIFWTWSTKLPFIMMNYLSIICLITCAKDRDMTFSSYFSKLLSIKNLSNCYSNN